MSDSHRLSQATYDRLTAEHEHLTTEGRIEIARRIEAARELGDLKENAEYHSAKEEQGKMETRIAHLKSLLENAEIVDESDIDDAVTAGCVVELAFGGNPEDTDIYLVGSIEERHEDFEVVSPTSPMGAAIMGKQVGDSVSFEAPGGTVQVQVLAIGR